MTCRKGEANTPSHSVKLLALFIGYKMKRLTQETIVGGQLYYRTRKSVSQPFGGWMRVLTKKKKQL